MTIFFHSKIENLLSYMGEVRLKYNNNYYYVSEKNNMIRMRANSCTLLMHICENRYKYYYEKEYIYLEVSISEFEEFFNSLLYIFCYLVICFWHKYCKSIILLKKQQSVFF